MKILVDCFLSRGKRGFVYLGKYGNKKCVIKVKRPGIGAIGRVENEGKWLGKLNKYKIGPKLYFCDCERVVMEYVKGEHLKDFLKYCDLKLVKKVFLDILKQCRILDKLKVNKYEMHRITKNVIVCGKKAVLIDFERCKIVENPKNVTQFCQFLMKSKLFNINRGVVRDYKKEQSEKNFKKILKFFHE